MMHYIVYLVALVEHYTVARHFLEGAVNLISAHALLQRAKKVGRLYVTVSG